MPGNVPVSATPTTVFPSLPYVAFSRSKAYRVASNVYNDNSSQRELISDTSQSTWQLTAKLRAAEVAALRQFFADHLYGIKPFYFYDPFDTVPKFSHDNTGAATAGRYIAVFEGGLVETSGLVFTEVSFSLKEVL